MDTPIKKTRLEFLFDVFKKDYDKAIKANVLEVEPRTRKKPEVILLEF